MELPFPEAEAPVAAAGSPRARAAPAGKRTLGKAMRRRVPATAFLAIVILLLAALGAAAGWIWSQRTAVPGVDTKREELVARQGDLRREGLALLSQGNVEGAYEKFTELRRIAPSSPGVAKVMAQLDQIRGEQASVQQRTREAQEKLERRTEALRGEAVLESDSGLRGGVQPRSQIHRCGQLPPDEPGTARPPADARSGPARRDARRAGARARRSGRSHARRRIRGRPDRRRPDGPARRREDRARDSLRGSRRLPPARSPRREPRQGDPIGQARAGDLRGRRRNEDHRAEIVRPGVPVRRRRTESASVSIVPRRSSRSR